MPVTPGVLDADVDPTKSWARRIGTGCVGLVGAIFLATLLIG
jgi:hypothetical protein